MTEVVSISTLIIVCMEGFSVSWKTNIPEGVFERMLHDTEATLEWNVSL